MWKQETWNAANEVLIMAYHEPKRFCFISLNIGIHLLLKVSILNNAQEEIVITTSVKPMALPCFLGRPLHQCVPL